jgi:hypothetical protein
MNRRSFLTALVAVPFAPLIPKVAPPASKEVSSGAFIAAVRKHMLEHARWLQAQEQKDLIESGRQFELQLKNYNGAPLERWRQW